MKTLSVITIVFLPGTFLATVFALDIITFKDGQEGWIYGAVVIPLTALMMICWLLWIKKNPIRFDEEIGYSSVPSQSSKGEKGTKEA